MTDSPQLVPAAAPSASSGDAAAVATGDTTAKDVANTSGLQESKDSNTNESNSNTNNTDIFKQSFNATTDAVTSNAGAASTAATTGDAAGATGAATTDAATSIKSEAQEPSQPEAHSEKPALSETQQTETAETAGTEAAEKANPETAENETAENENENPDTTADAEDDDRMQTETATSASPATESVRESVVEPDTDTPRDHSLPPRAEDVVARIKESHQRPSKRAKHGSDSDREDSAPPTVSPTVEVNNDGVLEAVAGFERRIVGSVVYVPQELLFKKYDDNLNCIVEVRVARRWLSRNHAALRDRALWGTGVYTDDSDIVAALYHEGYLSDDKFGDSGCDLMVQVVILPSLKQYQGSTRHELNSRTWLSPHDGTSILIANVSPMAQGSAENPFWRRREAAHNWSEAYALSRPASGRATPSPAEV